MMARRREPIVRESGRVANMRPIDCAKPLRGLVAIVPELNSLYIVPIGPGLMGADGFIVAIAHRINNSAGANNIRTIMVTNDPVSIYLLLRFFEPKTNLTLN
jgi:hypothetical protein